MNISTTFKGLDGEAEQAAVAILAFPDPPKGYQIRESENGRSVTSHIDNATTVEAALRATFTSDDPAANRFADKHIKGLGVDGETIQVHVNIGGGSYIETVYYDKVDS